jgi:alkylated DNA repair dioxygenase AlkB
MTKRKYSKFVYNLGDNANITLIPKYIKNSDKLFDELFHKISWEKFKYKVYDKMVTSPRLMHIIHFSSGDNNILPELIKAKQRLEKISSVSFNYAVLNYYRDGNDYIGFHPDREVKAGQIVASVSLGATRRFILKHRYRDDIKHIFTPNHGDVLILNDAAIKTMYKHSIPKMANVGPRISITFRE